MLPTRWSAPQGGPSLECPVNAMTHETKSHDLNLTLQAFWLEWWMMPITLTAQMMGIGRPEVDEEPEIDRECEDCQLPVPNSHQQSGDHDLFA